MPLEAIIGVVIALLVFIPVCMGVSKYFRTSQQAEDSFQSLVKELSAFSSSDLNDLLVLKLDAGTAIIGFTRNSPVYLNGGTTIYAARGDSATVTSERFFSVPLECSEFPCICLCQQFETAPETTIGIDNVLLSRSELTCSQKACETVPQIKLARDFVIIRETSQEARRVEILLTQEPGGVVLTTQ